jgi:hypothetical protein
MKILLLKSYSVYVKEGIHLQIHLHHNSFLKLKVRKHTKPSKAGELILVLLHVCVGKIYL